MIGLPAGTKVWLAAGTTDMRSGFNGLAASVIIIMALAIATIAVQHNDMLVATLGFLGAGSALGFLLVNFPRGKLFLGDGGAYFLGFWVAEGAILLLVRNTSVNAWQVLSICAYPVIEVMFSMYRRRIIQQSFNIEPAGNGRANDGYQRLL